MFQPTSIFQFRTHQNSSTHLATLSSEEKEEVLSKKSFLRASHSFLKSLAISIWLVTNSIWYLTSRKGIPRHPFTLTSCENFPRRSCVGEQRNENPCTPLSENMIWESSVLRYVTASLNFLHESLMTRNPNVFFRETLGLLDVSLRDIRGESREFEALQNLIFIPLSIWYTF